MRIPAILAVFASASILGQIPAPEAKPPSLPSLEHHTFNPKIPAQFSGKMIEVSGQDGTRTGVYASGPEDAKKQILLIHEWWGLNAHVKGVADQFGRMGYRAYAVDLYDGKSAEKPEEARALMAAAMDDQQTCAKKLATVVAVVKSRHEGGRLGVMGWCFGGGWALRCAMAAGAGVDACVIYYGQLVTDAKELSGLQAPVLGIFAKRDGWITLDQVEKFRAALSEAGRKDAEIHVYDADHAFANPSQTRFHEESARQAWTRTVEFLEKRLQPVRK